MTEHLVAIVSASFLSQAPFPMRTSHILFPFAWQAGPAGRSWSSRPGQRQDGADPGYRRQAVPYRKDPAHPLVQHVGYGAAGVPNCFEVRLGRRLRAARPAPRVFSPGLSPMGNVSPIFGHDAKQFLGLGGWHPPPPPSPGK